MELVLVLVIALVVFGPKRLPDMGHSMGKGMREFKDALTWRFVPGVARTEPA